MDHRRHRGELRDAAVLALVPVGVAVVLGLLLAPRRPLPDGVPLPVPDRHLFALVVAGDHALAQRARAEALPGPVRALGSAIRDFHTLEAHDSDARALGDARRAIDEALIAALSGGSDSLRALRSLQLEGFLEEVRRFQTTGEESPELVALSGRFVRSMRSEGWCDGHTLVPTEDVLRVLFKDMWHRLLGLDKRAEFAVSLDEERVAFAFYLSHPHPTKAMRESLAAARRGAHDARACEAIVEGERAAVDAFRLERIARLSAVDPAYPADYARGLVHLRRGDYGASDRALRKWLDEHPDGPLTLRAQNYLRAAIDGERTR